MALLDWIIDFFKWLLNLLERFIYAVDEWLRFHSGETWVSVVLKAVVGVVWSFVSFLLRIYVNLLIEPTLHPVKHFPVVTVPHKIFLPVILVIEHQMRETLTPYLGVALAGPITWFNIVFLPGIFGFLVVLVDDPDVFAGILLQYQCDQLLLGLLMLLRLSK